MLCIVSPTTDPFFNLAAEEYLFKIIGDDVFFLYINAPSVVVGKHQNAMAEINPLFVYQNDIKVIRRISGGGAVYHDTGNLNFLFHKTVDDTAKVSFKDFNLPIVEVLQKLGVPAEISNRNDIVVNGFKVSGHAQHVFRNRVMSHGTLLIETDLEKLSNALRKGSGVYESKAIPSVRSQVANIQDFLSKPFSAEKFMEHFNHHFLNAFSNAKEYHFNDSDLNCIRELIDNKYSKWEWNFGYSPAYQFINKMVSSSGKSLSCLMKVEKGIIINVRLDCDDMTQNEKIEMGLINQPHHPEFILKYFEKVFLQQSIKQQLAELFF
jgi:lipoate---protein ligase